MIKDDMKQVAHRFIILIFLGCALAMQCRAGRAGEGGGAWPPAPREHALVWAAALFALLALPLWRGWQLSGQLAETRRALAGEAALRASAEQALLVTHASLCKLVALQEGVKESERRRIGRDIHDDLGQNLLALKLDICMLQSGAEPAQTALRRRLDLLAQHIDLSIHSLRSIIHDLRPEALAGGLQTAIEWQLSEFGRLNGIHYELEAGQDAFDGGTRGELDTIVFRILQESLSNIARHAKATEVKIALRRDAARLTMTVRDNGVGMAGTRPGGCGLRGIQERVAQAGGQLQIDSSPGHGTALSLSLPLAAA